MGLCQQVSLATPTARAVVTKNVRSLCISNIAMVALLTLASVLMQLISTVCKVMSKSISGELQDSYGWWIASSTLPVLTLIHICAVMVATAVADCLDIDLFGKVPRTVNSPNLHSELEAGTSSALPGNTPRVAVGVLVLSAVETAATHTTHTTHTGELSEAGSADVARLGNDPHSLGVISGIVSGLSFAKQALNLALETPESSEYQVYDALNEWQVSFAHPQLYQNFQSFIGEVRDTGLYLLQLEMFIVRHFLELSRIQPHGNHTRLQFTHNALSENIRRTLDLMQEHGIRRRGDVLEWEKHIKGLIELIV